MAETLKKTSPYGSVKFKSIEEYHASFPENIQEILTKLHQTIKKNAPDAKEIISYNMPAFKQKRNLVYYAANKNHIGFYPSASPIVVFKEELSGLKTSKGAIQFPLNQELPFELIAKIVAFRVEEDSKGT